MGALGWDVTSMEVGGGREDNIKRDPGEKGLEHSGIWNFPPKLNHTVPNRKQCPSCL